MDALGGHTVQARSDGARAKRRSGAALNVRQESGQWLAI
jgi:hypothetical protein